MQLFGTVTSPFVRRVRIVAAELGVEVTRVDTATEQGQAQLLAVSPIRKVPVAIVDDRLLFDSRVIVEWLTTTRGWGTLAPPRDPWRMHNLINAIDAAIEAAISLFYLRRDGVAVDGSPYATRQLDRVKAIFDMLTAERNAQGTGFWPTDGSASHFGLAEASLCCALDWMKLRNAYPIETAPLLTALAQHWSTRPSVAATVPTAG